MPNDTPLNDPELDPLLVNARKAHLRITAAYEARNDAVLTALDAGAKQVELAQYLGVSHSAIQYMAKGARTLRAEGS